MKSINIISAIFLFMLAGCGENSQTSSTEKKLNSYSTITDYFTQKEIKDLAKLLDFFNEQICVSSGIDKKKIIECYDGFIEKFNERVMEGIIDVKIPFDEQQRMYKQISDSLFHQIWILSSWVGRNSPDTLKSINYNFIDGRYMKFMNELGKDYEMIKEYCEVSVVHLGGGISPSMVEDIMMIKERYNYDLNDIRLQLVVAIHYLTQNDLSTRNKEYYEELLRNRK
jgi:hypothetical protein